MRKKKNLIFIIICFGIFLVVFYIVSDVLGFSLWYIRNIGKMRNKSFYDSWVTFMPTKVDDIDIMKGLQKTYNSFENDNAKIVWLFGGSTMQGSGSYETTIPSYLAKISSRQKLKYYFVNFGVAAFVSDQETRLLLLLLKSFGKAPDLCIFYDGANDFTFHSYCLDPFAHYEFQKYKSIVEPKIGNIPVVYPLYRMWEMSYAKILYFGIHKRLVGEKYYEDKYKSILDKSILEYKKRSDFMERLGNAFEFNTVFALQPFLLEEFEPKIELEREIWINSPSQYRKLVKYYYDRMRDTMEEKSSFIDLSHVLKNRTEKYYKDVVHINAEGRKQVAQALLNTLIEKNSLSRE